jgi:hypothetical protein
VGIGQSVINTMKMNFLTSPPLSKNALRDVLNQSKWNSF